jgi:hypothetical protein
MRCILTTVCRDKHRHVRHLCDIRPSEMPHISTQRGKRPRYFAIAALATCCRQAVPEQHCGDKQASRKEGVVLPRGTPSMQS